MPLPSLVARVNRRLTNRLVRRFAGSAGSLGMLEHRGRSTGTLHRTPLMAFPAPAGFAMALTYGERVDWLRNVQAAGGASLTWRGKRYQLEQPEVVQRKPEGVTLPRWARLIIFLVRARSWLVVTAWELPGDAM